VTPDLQGLPPGSVALVRNAGTELQVLVLSAAVQHSPGRVFDAVRMFTEQGTVPDVSSETCAGDRYKVWLLEQDGTEPGAEATFAEGFAQGVEWVTGTIRKEA
jgi:hypothetical protein